MPGEYCVTESSHLFELNGPIFLSRDLANNHLLLYWNPSHRCWYEAKQKASGGNEMLWTIFMILLVLWLVGLVSSYTLGGFIHLLLVAAVIVLILQLVSGRRPVV
jgi:hypothetical protein